ncbi:MAG: class I SAM-dependent methyltransferase [Gaiella sp.]
MSDERVRQRLALQAERATELSDRLERVLAPLAGTERVLDAGCGAGAFALAIAPHVHEVIGVDHDPALLEAARGSAPASCTFVEGDVTDLPFGYGAFDLVGCLRVLHHTPRPPLVVAELARVTRPGGRVLVVDQLGDVDPLRSLEADRFERERDPTHERLLPDADIRGLIEANDLVIVHDEVVRETRHIDPYLDVAGLEGDERERVRRMAPASEWVVEIGWYLARKFGA